MSRPRVFSSSLTSRQRLVYGAATAWFAGVSAAMLWPIYPLFSGVRPMVAGLPLSLAYLVGLLVVSFVAGLALYLWEDREGVFDGPGSGEGKGAASPPPPPETRT